MAEWPRGKLDHHRQHPDTSINSLRTKELALFINRIQTWNSSKDNVRLQPYKRRVQPWQHWPISSQV